MDNWDCANGDSIMIEVLEWIPQTVFNLASLTLFVKLNNKLVSEKFKTYEIKNTSEHSKIFKRLEKTDKYIDTEIFFEEIDILGVDVIVEILEEDGKGELINQYELLKDINPISAYIIFVTKSIQQFSRELITAGINEKVSQHFLLSRMSFYTQKARVNFNNHWNTEMAETYFKSGKLSRNRLRKKILLIAKDKANNKEKRFKIAILDYTHEFASNLFIFYYKHGLGEINEKEVEL